MFTVLNSDSLRDLAYSLDRGLFHFHSHRFWFPKVKFADSCTLALMQAMICCTFWNLTWSRCACIFKFVLVLALATIEVDFGREVQEFFRFCYLAIACFPTQLMGEIRALPTDPPTKGHFLLKANLSLLTRKPMFHLGPRRRKSLIQKRCVTIVSLPKCYRIKLSDQ